MGELIFNGVLFVFFLAMTFYSGTIKIWQGYFGARYWPMLILIITDVIFAAKTIAIYKALPIEKRSLKLDLKFFKDKSIQRLLLSFLSLIIYAAVVEVLGFFISTIILGMVLSLLIGLKHFGKLFLSNLVMTIAIYSIFVWGLDIMVPRGAGFLYYFGYWLEFLV